MDYEQDEQEEQFEEQAAEPQADVTPWLKFQHLLINLIDLFNFLRIYFA